ncbi:MAG TPA: ATP-grasp domain-containing protein [Planctomycetaceae bacterium]|nr:ATP-grasp domain-containing protein [Planctomycetaceae bacterium]
MRIAVLEAVCAGLCGENPPPSLLAEGLAMWRALIEDLLLNPQVTIETVVDDRWFAMTPSLSRVHAWRVSDVTESMTCWQNCLDDTEATWIIAPECDGLLQQLVEMLPPSHRSWNASPEAIALCADKLALAQHLARHSVATIPTVSETWQSPPHFDEDSKFVIKPRDGAGSQLVRRIADQAAWKNSRQEYRGAGDPPAIRQPFIPGTPLSIAGWFDRNGVQWFPVAEQVLGEDFVYCGGVIAARVDDEAHATVQRLVTVAVATIPGLQGYVGFDVLLPERRLDTPVLVEINPRLTTSCLGIRRLCRGDWLASLMTDPSKPLEWHTDRRIEFTSQGVVREVPLS